MESTKTLAVIQQEVNQELANKASVELLVKTTFKGLAPEVMPQAICEGMMRGFTFRDFLEKNIYAIPYGSGYSLVTSIDHARKIGAKSGVVGKTEPSYDDGGADGKEASCSITIKKRFADGYVGDFTARVYFSEFSTGKNQWATKPRMMIAKVAEMHALRMACPEELAQAYAEEEMQKPLKPETLPIDIGFYQERIEATKTTAELQQVWADLPPEAKKELTGVKDAKKKEHEDAKV